MIDFEEFKKRYQKVPVEEYPNRVVETMPEPMVSVHVSTYQHADFIHDCMEGVLMQETDFPFEIIIGEDESDDGTREICKEYAERYPERIRLFLHRRENNIAINGQPTGRFQFVYSHFVARGKYIAICEGDDYWTDPEKLQKQVQFMEETEEYSYTYHPFQKFIVNENEYGQKGLQSASDEKWPATATLLFENRFDKYPLIYFEVLHADAFLKRRLEIYGESRRIEGIRPSVYRVHKNGIYGGGSSVQKTYEVLRSNSLMLEFFKETNRGEYIEHRIKEYFIKTLKGAILRNKWTYVINSLELISKTGITLETLVELFMREVRSLVIRNITNK